MQRQEENRFNQLLEENKQSIFRICKIYATLPIQPEDLFQEVVFQVWKSLPDFKGKSSISTWIYRIALNVCIRSKDRLTKGNLNAIQLDSIEFKIAATEPDDDQQAKYRALHACISSLEKGDRALVVLYLEDLSYKKIAEITELSENHVAVKMKRIRKKLLNCITPKLN